MGKSEWERESASENKDDIFYFNPVHTLNVYDSILDSECTDYVARRYTPCSMLSMSLWTN